MLVCCVSWASPAWGLGQQGLLVAPLSAGFPSPGALCCAQSPCPVLLLLGSSQGPGSISAFGTLGFAPCSTEPGGCCSTRGEGRGAAGAGQPWSGFPELSGVRDVLSRSLSLAVCSAQSGAAGARPAFPGVLHSWGHCCAPLAFPQLQGCGSAPAGAGTAVPQSQQPRDSSCAASGSPLCPLPTPVAEVWDGVGFEAGWVWVSRSSLGPGCHLAPPGSSAPACRMGWEFLGPVGACSTCRVVLPDFLTSAAPFSVFVEGPWVPLGVPQAVGESVLCLLWDGSLSFCQEAASQQLAGGGTGTQQAGGGNWAPLALGAAAIPALLWAAQCGGSCPWPGSACLGWGTAGPHPHCRERSEHRGGKLKFASEMKPRGQLT